MAAPEEGWKSETPRGSSELQNIGEERSQYEQRDIHLQDEKHSACVVTPLAIRTIMKA